MAGAVIGLGAIGVTLTYAILRFANFAHGEFIAWGAYFTLCCCHGLFGWLVAGGIGWADRALLLRLRPDSGGRPSSALLLTGASRARVSTVCCSRPLREDRRAGIVAIMIASFGASLALRSLHRIRCSRRVPAYFTRANCRSRSPLGFGVRAITPNQVAALGRD